MKTTLPTDLVRMVSIGLSSLLFCYGVFVCFNCFIPNPMLYEGRPVPTPVECLAHVLVAFGFALLFSLPPRCFQTSMAFWSGLSLRLFAAGLVFWRAATIPWTAMPDLALGFAVGGVFCLLLLASLVSVWEIYSFPSGRKFAFRKKADSGNM